MVRNLLGAVGLGAILCLALTPAAQDDEADAVFNDLFGGKVRAALASVDRADDVAVARELLKSAELVAQQPRMFALLCDHAYDLGRRDPSGYSTAIDAMMLLMKHLPQRGGEALERVFDVRQRQLTVAKAEERAAIGEAMMDVMVQLAELKRSTHDYADAASAYRRALSLARSTKSSRLDAIKAALDEVTERERLLAQIARLQAEIAAKPDEPGPARELIMIHVVELDDPAGAAPHLAAAKDTVLQTRAALAAKPLQDVSQPQALDLGEWYRELADQTTATLAKRKLLTRSLAYLKHYLSTKAPGDLSATKAQLLVNATTASLAKLGGPAPISLPEPTSAPPVAAGHADDTVTDLGKLKPVALFTAPAAAEGIALVAAANGPASTTEIAGRQAIIMDGAPLHLSIDDKLAHDLAEAGDERWFIRLTVLDQIAGNIGLVYDGHPCTLPANGNGAHTQTMWLQLKGDNQWTHIDFELPNARFANRHAHDGDFRIITGGDLRPLHVHQVSLLRIKLPAKTQRLLKPGDSVDLLKLITPAVDAARGTWEQGPTELQTTRAFFARTSAPIVVTGSYDLKVQLKRVSGGGSVNLMLPVGDRHVACIIDGYGRRGGISGLETIGGKLVPDNATATPGMKLTNDKYHTAEARIRITGGKADIQVDLDGQSLIRWSGSMQHLTGSAWRLADWRRPGLGAYNSPAAFKSAHLTIVDGEAVVLTSAKLYKAAITTGNRSATSAAAGDDAVALSTLNEKVASAAAFGKRGKMGSMAFIRINGVDLDKSLAIFPAENKPARLLYDLAGKYRSLTGAVGINDVGQEPHSDVTFSIVADGKEIWKSQPTRARRRAQPFAVTITGVKKLELVVACSGKSNFCNSVWVEPMLHEKEVGIDTLTKPDAGGGGGKSFFGVPID